MKTAMMMALILVGCGGGDELVYMGPVDFCNEMTKAYCDDDAQCYVQPQMCEMRAEYYQMCADTYGCNQEGIWVDTACFAAIRGQPDTCDAPVGIPAECPPAC
jgi:hypothetical protein